MKQAFDSADCATRQTAAECVQTPAAHAMNTADSIPATARSFLAIGAVAASLAVVFGAFGAHALKARVAPEALQIYKTGVEYHFYHALGLILLGLAALRLPDSARLRAAGWTMLAGIVLFSGSLYLLALTGLAWLGAIAPLGGSAFILAWCLFAAAAIGSP
jgi:uncharacterized membrane protein YgdD (TMEM256/DUF423 family)